LPASVDASDARASSVRIAGAPRRPNAQEATMKYMLLLYGDSSHTRASLSPDSPEVQAEFAAWGEVTQRLTESGAMVAGDPLQGTETATTVRGPDQVVSDGPFAETKETLIGYYLLDVPDLDDALRWARQMPNLAYGSVELRPLMEIRVA
jgi:hypothetical protein